MAGFIYSLVDKFMSVNLAELSRVELAALQRIHWTEENYFQMFPIYFISLCTLSDFIYDCYRYYIFARISNEQRSEERLALLWDV
jgi:hypothetical protein